MLVVVERMLIVCVVGSIGVGGVLINNIAGVRVIISSRQRLYCCEYGLYIDICAMSSANYMLGTFVLLV